MGTLICLSGNCDDHHLQHQTHKIVRDVYEVIALEKHPVLDLFEKQFSQRFHILKAWESELPLDKFLESHAYSVEALLCPSGGPKVTTDVLGRLPLVGVVITTSSGVDHIDLLECRRRRVAVANAGDVFSADVADMAVGMLIDVMRKISSADRHVRDGNWASLWNFPFGSRVGGKRIGIVGLGSIGLEIARRLDAFRCKISYLSRKKKECVPYQFVDNVLELATHCDALIVCCRLTKKTYHMIDRKVLLALGKDGVVVNVGRGPVINEKDLVKCLVKGEIRGAALDVFENEPNVPKELFGLGNVVLSPHRAVTTPEGLNDLSQLIYANLDAFFHGEPLLTPYVDK
ncbi:glyoxylate/hydroxypyruvate reductase HPR3-like [Humulus lupulus]|uniref:glyoxylate/hydroxypyruvate reductase HPR3-like n=1 Tax=Humulus lupulus TaxID=3486 RepID=UPI002B4112E0|nr:glyoxylate/hydroxypyruvate reductase HPR3-like [Humulus lupulus]